MNNQETKKPSSGLEFPDWKRVQIPAEVERLATAVVDSAFAVHLELGPGLLESAYEACLSHELRLRGVKHQLQLPVPLNYKGIRVEIGYRADVVVEVVDSREDRRLRAQALLSGIRFRGGGSCQAATLGLY